MTSFEQYLLDNSWLKFVYQTKTGTYKRVESYTISTMVNLDHRYFHESDTNILTKIENGLSTIDGGINYNDRTREIIFGLSEVGKPCTLISPRPNMIIDSDNERSLTETVEFRSSDDTMNIFLANTPNDKMLEAIFDFGITLILKLPK